MMPETPGPPEVEAVWDPDDDAWSVFLNRMASLPAGVLEAERFDAGTPPRPLDRAGRQEAEAAHREQEAAWHAESAPGGLLAASAAEGRAWCHRPYRDLTDDHLRIALAALDAAARRPEEVMPHV